MIPRRILAVLVAAVAASAALAVPARATELIDPTGEAIEIESSKGSLIRLDQTPTAIFIADPAIADVEVKSPRLVYILGKKPGETTLYAVDQEDRVILSRRIHVSHNVTRLKESLRKMIPSSQIEVQAIDDTLVLGGVANTAADAENARQMARALVASDAKLVNQIKVVEPNQVNLRVRIAEVSRSVIKQFGINWDALFRSGAFTYGIATGAPVISTPFFGTGTKEFTSRNDGTNSLLGFFETDNADVNAVVDALEDEGLVTILAEPNLTSLSGEPATFLAGGEFPILVPDDGNVTVEFKQFGVSLAFTPTLISHNRISLKVNPEVSQLSTAGQASFSGFTVPALTTRRAETTVELGSGQSFAIAGLIQNNITQSLNKFPGLSDIPILGALFTSSSFRKDETELVIIVTPYIVRPVSPGMIASPTDGLIPPNDVDRVLHGRNYRTSLQRRRRNIHSSTVQGLEGPSGFVLN